MTRHPLILSLGLSAALSACAPPAPKAAVAVRPVAAVVPTPMRVLVFGDAAKAGLVPHGYEVEATTDAAKFTAENLARCRAVVFAGTSGAALNQAQREAFEDFIQSGGGFVGIDAAADAARWPWYARLLGGPQAAHPELKTTVIGKRAFDGGRVWYTGPGFAAAALSQADFAKQLAEGVAFAARLDAPQFGLNPELRLPTDDYFETEELASGLEDPMGIAPLPDGRVLIIERTGAVKLHTPERGVRTIARLDVMPVPDVGWYEGGGLGIAVDPDFGAPDNNFIYIYHSLPDRQVIRLSRYRFQSDGTLADEVTLLEVPDDRGARVCHVGGHLAFGADRNLYLSCGDNTCPFDSSGYSPTDERSGRASRDAQRSAGNSNDLRGGVLRIRINENGIGYTIPAGNLWPVGTAKTRPETFVKGCRNPWRFAVDSKTGGVAWGDVGPDAGHPNANRGPGGYDCIGFAPTPGYYGWPYARGPRAFYHRFDFATGKSGPSFADGIENRSPNNTGLAELPPVRPTLVWYPPGNSAEFPEVEHGGRTACVGVVYNQEGRDASFPAWFDHVLVSFEWTRRWVKLIKLDGDDRLESIQDWLGSLPLKRPVDMVQDRHGNLFVLDYGSNWTGNHDGRLFKVAFSGWSRPPRLSMDTADRIDGLKTRFEFSATAFSPEKLAMTAHWDFGDGTSFTQADLPATPFKAAHTFTRAGHYTTILTVTDSRGIARHRKVQVYAGNTRPEIRVSFKEAPASFHWGQALPLEVKATDAEDGDLAAKAVVSARFGQPFAKPPVHPRLAGLNPDLPGAALMVANGCISCHTATDASGGNAGPAYFLVADRYKKDRNFAAHLKESIRHGSTGRWKESHMAMPPFPDLSTADVNALAAAIQSLAAPRSVAVPVVEGVVRLPATEPKGLPKGSFLTVRAEVTDGGGANDLAPLSASAQATLKPVAEKKKGKK